MVFHFASNLFVVIMSPTFTGSERIQYVILFYVFGFVAALVLAWRSRFKFGWRGAEA
jgi:hypothetical protein